jgi:transcriptional regulator with XRE-family HTH domain
LLSTEGQRRGLAHESGINRTYLSGVERSERNVSIDNIARIARGLKVKPYVLLDDSA